MAPDDMDEEEIAELVGMEEDNHNESRINELRHELKRFLGRRRKAERSTRIRAEKNKLLARKQASSSNNQEEQKEEVDVRKEAIKRRKKKEKDLFKPLARKPKPKRRKA